MDRAKPGIRSLTLAATSPDLPRTSTVAMSVSEWIPRHARSVRVPMR